MKKLLLPLLSLILVLFSCENEALEGFDLNNQNPSNNSLIGTWTLVSFTADVNSTTETGGMTIESDVTIESNNPDYDVTFTSNTFSTTGSYGYNVSSTVNGQNTVQDLSVQNVSGAGTYTDNGDDITIDGSFFTLEFQGVDLSQAQGEQTVPYTISADGQTLTFNQNTTETNSQGGATITSTNVSTSVWSKTSSSNTACEDATSFAASAEAAYNNDNTNVDLCNAYKSALQNQISACGDTSGAIQTIIDDLGDCQPAQPNEIEISLTAGTLPIEFDQVSVVTVGNTLQVTGATSAQNNYMIYFEINIGDTSVDAINPEFVLTLSTTDPNYFPNTDGFDDFTSTITNNTQGSLTGSFGGIVTNSTGGDLSLSQGVINITY